MKNVKNFMFKMNTSHPRRKNCWSFFKLKIKITTNIIVVLCIGVCDYGISCLLLCKERRTGLNSKWKSIDINGMYNNIRIHIYC